MAEGVDLAAGRGLVDERIVGGDGVAAATRRMVDVDPQDRGPQVGDVLPGPVWIFGKVVAAVSGRYEEHPVGAEGEAAAVVAARGPGDHLDLARRVGSRHATVVDHRQSHHPCAVGSGLPRLVAEADRVAEVAEAVGREGGVEGEVEDAAKLQGFFRGALRVEPRYEIACVEEQVGLTAVAIGRQRVHLAIQLRDEAAVAVRREGQRGRGREPHVLVDFAGLQRWWRLGCARHQRGRPGLRSRCG